MAEEDNDNETSMEVVALKVAFDLVPEWSEIVERIARHHSERVEVGFEGHDLVVKAAVAPGIKPKMMADIARYWDPFVERRKREGRWSGR